MAWRRAAPRTQAAPQPDWMDDEAWQAVRSHAAARRVHQKSQPVSIPGLAQDIHFEAEARRATGCGRETLGVARLCGVAVDWEAQAKAARNATWKSKTALVGVSGGLHGAPGDG